jgi:hypothetical protein
MFMVRELNRNCNCTVVFVEMLFTCIFMNSEVVTGARRCDIVLFFFVLNSSPFFVFFSLFFPSCHCCSLPNVVVEWLTPLLIRDVRVQILAQRPVILTQVFLVFLSSSKRIPGYYVKIKPRPLPSRSFSVHHPLITLSFDAV